ncbi:Riboflavin biosynthesis protein RibBA [Zancudomyces culisetae]|uniref:3,4-dihydroxy-2-butanone 4-phosphate synthase n=1 Tax=Zancudomyces culisetae TaxID=1213189 RepID=A0A1R1PTW7_ZANCU|nr:Riboflavin biosynthesis protein RibBA [Zancudomyces culisetae]|eukprot:OMH84410.1 Riboflavin biosynthesis protein RibBA [Zancudomyces culisetae]
MGASENKGDCVEKVVFDSVDSAIADIKLGKAVVVVDNEDRENEADLIFAAEKSTPELLAFTVRHTSGYVCCAVKPSRLDDLQLPLLVPREKSSDPNRTSYTLPVDHIATSTGISAQDRALTLAKLADESEDMTQFRRPGHVIPLLPNDMGVLGRNGHTEAAYDLARLAGLYPAGVLCELVNNYTDGSCMRRPQSYKFAKEHGLKYISINGLIEYIKQNGINSA